MNKNVVIFILVVFTILGSIWGSVANKKRISMEKQLSDSVAEVQKLTDQNSKEREQILGKTAGLQENLVAIEQQLRKARKELVSLRKSSQGLESKLSECTSSLQVANKKNTTLADQLQAAEKKVAVLVTASREPAEKIAEPKKEPVVAVAAPEEKPEVKQEVKLVDERAVQQAADVGSAEKIRILEEQVQASEVVIEQLQEDLNAANAQIIGLEKIVDEKNAEMDETTQEMDRLKINMDVLLSKVAEQQDEIQEIQEEKRDLVKELAAKNEELADLQEEVMQNPVQQ